MATPTVHHGAMFDTNELVINMGPQHPSTHGVLRVVLRLDGGEWLVPPGVESVTDEFGGRVGRVTLPAPQV